MCTLEALPLGFEPNVGQAPPEVSYLAQGGGYAIFLTPTESVIRLAASQFGQTDDILRMRLEGRSGGLTFEAEGSLPGVVNRYNGNDPSRCFTGIPTSSAVRSPDVYPGIDLIQKGVVGLLEYDFVVAPGADPDRIAMAFEGAGSIELDAAGNLVLTVGSSTLVHHAPNVFQEEADGSRRGVDASYVVGEDGCVRFDVGEYDPSLPLVIDPVVAAATFISGYESISPTAIAVDADGGYIAIVGSTDCPVYPLAGKPPQDQLWGHKDMFVCQLMPGGSNLLFSTFLGDDMYFPSSDAASDVAFDSVGDVYVTGEVSYRGGGWEFLTTPDAYQAHGSGGTDAVVVKLNGRTGEMEYGTFIGGGRDDAGLGIAVDTLGCAYVTGWTFSSDLFSSSVPGFVTINADDQNQAAFVAKLNRDGTDLDYATYIRSPAGSEYGAFIEVDAAGRAFVVGGGSSDGLPTTIGAYLAHPVNHTSDFWALKLNPAGTLPEYLTYVGGTWNEVASDMALDSSGNCYVTGWVLNPAPHSLPPGLPVKNAAQPNFGGGSYDGFVLKLNSTGSALDYCTYLGGNGFEEPSGIAVDSAGRAIIVGRMEEATSFPLVDPMAQRSKADGFVTRLSPAGNTIEFSSPLGCSYHDSAIDVAVHGSEIYVCGSGPNLDLVPVTPAVIQGPNLIWQSNVFVARLSAGSQQVVNLVSIAPATVFTESGDTTITLVGEDFQANSHVIMGGLPLATTYVSSTTLTAVIPASMMANVTTYNVHIASAPLYDSNTITFQVVTRPQPPPLSGGLAPGSDTGGSAEDGITRDNTPTFSGLGTPGAAVRITLRNQRTGQSFSVAGVAGEDGAWSIGFDQPVPDGSYDVLAEELEPVQPAAVRLMSLAEVPEVAGDAILLGSVLIDTQGPRIARLQFHPSRATLNLDFVDQGSGLDLAGCLNQAHYSVRKAWAPRAADRLVNHVTSVTLGSSAEEGTVCVGVAMDHGYPMRHARLLVQASGIEDLAGNALCGTFNGRFPTGWNGQAQPFAAQVTTDGRHVCIARAPLPPPVPRPRPHPWLRR